MGHAMTNSPPFEFIIRREIYHTARNLSYGEDFIIRRGGGIDHCLCPRSSTKAHFETHDNKNIYTLTLQSNPF
jgi:hypothetical protein